MYFLLFNNEYLVENETSYSFYVAFMKSKRYLHRPSWKPLGLAVPLKGWAKDAPG